MNRRSFIGTSVMGAVALAFAPRSLFAAKRQVLYGDGVHDDTEALQAWASNEPVYRPDGKRIPNHKLMGGAYKVTSTVVFRKNDCLMQGNSFELSEGAVLTFKDAKRVLMADVRVRGGGIR